MKCKWNLMFILLKLYCVGITSNIVWYIPEQDSSQFFHSFILPSSFISVAHQRPLSCPKGSSLPVGSAVVSTGLMHSLYETPLYVNGNMQQSLKNPEIDIFLIITICSPNCARISKGRDQKTVFCRVRHKNSYRIRIKVRRCIDSSLQKIF